jgi:Ca-activated chloride channel homolog
VGEDCSGPVRLCLLAILTAILLASAARLTGAVAPQIQQTPPVASDSPAQQESPFTLRSSVNLVLLHATVRDGNGRRVDNLTQSDFRVYEDDILQKLAVFSHADIPVTMGIVIDDSGSMRSLRPAVDAAAWSFVQTSNPADQAFVVTFNTAYQVDTPGAFATSKEQLKTALNHINSHGGTALYDAVYASLDHLKLGDRDKKVLLVISDGDDNASAHSFAQLLWLAARSNAEIYTIAPAEDEDNSAHGSSDAGSYATQVLKRLTQSTGGRAFFPDSLAQVDSVCRQIAHAIRDQYTLGYYPNETASEGAFRRVRVDAFAPNAVPPLTVVTRPGYYAPPGQLSPVISLAAPLSEKTSGN